jgi:ATP-binding cassette subfamily C (CFTR/MRP) protein 1
MPANLGRRTTAMVSLQQLGSTILSWRFAAVGTVYLSLLHSGAHLICTARYSQSMARFSTKLRSGLVSLIYYHTLSIHPEDTDLGAGTILMNVDVEKVMLGSAILHEFWTLVISCSIALYILYTNLGVTFVVPTVTSIVMAVVCFQVGKNMKPRQSIFTAATQKRVTAISNATGCMKAIRMLGLTGTVHKDLTKLREEEVDKQK